MRDELQDSVAVNLLTFTVQNVFYLNTEDHNAITHTHTKKRNPGNPLRSSQHVTF